MKYKALFLLIIYFSLLFSPLSSHAMVIPVPPLSPIPGTQIGASLGTIPSSSSTKISLNKLGGFQFDEGLNKLTAPIVAYNNLLVGGANIALGYAAQLSVDIEDAYNKGLLQANSILNDFINSYFNYDPNSTAEAAVNDIVDLSALKAFNSSYSTASGNYKITGFRQSSLTRFGNPSGQNIGDPPLWVLTNSTSLCYLYQRGYNPSGQYYYYYYKEYAVASSTADSTYPKKAPPVALPNADAPTFAKSLVNSAANNPALKNALTDVIAGNPNLVKTANAPAISAADLKAYAQSVANTAVNDKIAAIQAALAADPTNASLQVELAKAINDAIQQSAEQIAEQAKPPEPNYPVPSTWYTGKCNSLDIPSCFNYQPILDATDAFKNTAIYQAPNLVLKCLDYVKGDGCEYPPRISINLFSRYSSEQTNIDLTPFQSAVKVMKFFFSLLCFICTYKAVMTLFR